MIVSINNLTIVIKKSPSYCSTMFIKNQDGYLFHLLYTIYVSQT